MQWNERIQSSYDFFFPIVIGLANRHWVPRRQTINRHRALSPNGTSLMIKDDNDQRCGWTSHMGSPP